MTAQVTLEGGGFGAPRGARARAALGFAYAALIGGASLARSASVDNILRVGERAAARGVVLAGVVIVLAVLVVALRQAAIGIDDDGVSWGWGGLRFRAPAAKIVVCRVYQDAVAVVMRRGSVWYLSARDYTPFDRLAAAVRRAGFAIDEQPRPAPLAARLQAYGVALDLILALDVLGATLLLLA